MKKEIYILSSSVTLNQIAIGLHFLTKTVLEFDAKETQVLTIKFVPGFAQCYSHKGVARSQALGLE